MAETEKAILAGGCFWGVQDLIRKLDGVAPRASATPAAIAQRDLRQSRVPRGGDRDHVRPRADLLPGPARVLLSDPRPDDENRQGNDVGASYRSAIYYVDDEQRRSQRTRSPMSTPPACGRQGRHRGEPAGPFWEAEPEHQDYLERYPDGYTCHFVRPGWKLPRRAEQAAR